MSGTCACRTKGGLAEERERGNGGWVESLHRQTTQSASVRAKTPNVAETAYAKKNIRSDLNGKEAKLEQRYGLTKAQ